MENEERGRGFARPENLLFFFFNEEIPTVPFFKHFFLSNTGYGIDEKTRTTTRMNDEEEKTRAWLDDTSTWRTIPGHVKTHSCAQIHTQTESCEI